MAYAHKPSTPDAEPRGSRFKSYPWLHSGGSLCSVILPCSGHWKRTEGPDLFTAEKNTCHLHWPVKSQDWSGQEAGCEVCHQPQINERLLAIASGLDQLSLQVPTSPKLQASSQNSRAFYAVDFLPFPGGEDRASPPPPKPPCPKTSLSQFKLPSAVNPKHSLL